jgi:isopenicillin-N N-acyltransferase-like protein
VPYHIILRKALDARNMHKAIQAVTGARRGSSGNYMIGAAGGEIIDLEATPKCVEQLLPQDGVISHANHFSSPRLAQVDTHRNESTLTVIREDRSLRFLRKERESITIETFKRVLQDHFSFPHSICRHIDPAQNELDQTVTGASIIMDLDANTMHIAAGPPCENSFRAVELRSVM